MESASSRSIPPASAIFGSAKSMTGVRELTQRAALLHTPAFIYGPTGSGKEVLAHYIHLISPWKSGPFLKINCATEPELLETELFGFAEGAFPGASSSKRGLLELANEGTLLLDDISELDLRLQEKLLGVLQDRTFMPVGGHQSRSTSVRIMSTAIETLETKVAEGHFRHDLFERLGCVSLGLPPLRERIEDVPAIARYLLSRFTGMLGNPLPTLSAAAIQRLSQYEWPGNIRELENVLFRYALITISRGPAQSFNSCAGEADLLDGLPIPAKPEEKRSAIMRQEAVRNFQELNNGSGGWRNGSP